MASPIPDQPMAAPSTNPDTTQQDTERDTDMEDQPQDPSSGTVANASSSTQEGDPSTQQQPQDTQATSGTTTYPHQNRKDVTLREFLSRMDDYAPIIPDAVTSHYLTVSGLPPPSPHDPSGATTNTTPLPLARLLALATQKFIADIAADAYQFSRIRASNTASANNPLGSTALPGQVGAAGVGGLGGVGGGGVKGGQGATQLGVQRAGYGGGGQGGSGQGKTVLTMEDLGMAVHEYGVNVKRGEFYR